jgi:hypothetical protein
MNLQRRWFKIEEDSFEKKLSEKRIKNSAGILTFYSKILEFEIL